MLNAKTNLGNTIRNLMEKWTLKASNWVRFSNSSSGWRAFIWSDYPLPGQTMRRAELTLISVLLFLLGIAFFCFPRCCFVSCSNGVFVIEWCDIIHNFSVYPFSLLFGCLIYTPHVICPKLSSWFIQLAQAFSFLHLSISVDENTILPVA